MGRRKKEPASAHRSHIATAAGQLFARKGPEDTTMDEIADAAGYSKATVYVYFKNKEEIVSFLALESMKKLRDYISLALSDQRGTYSRYQSVCYALVQYQEEFPCYFHIVLQEIKAGPEKEGGLPIEQEIFEVGEQINEMLSQFLQSGIDAGDIRPDLSILPTVFSLWAMMAGLIRMAAEKADYIKKSMDLTKREFLQYGFEVLYHSISSGR